MKLNVINSDGGKGEAISVDKSVFGIKPNESVVHQAVIAELANSRQGTHASKNRSAVKGGGKKPFKQKGRGVARAGTIRSPLWKGGGVVFGPEPHSYKHKLPKKMKKLARRSVLSDKLSKGEFMVLDKINIETKKTSEFVSMLKELKLENKKVTMLVSSFHENLVLSSRNVRNVFIEDVRNISVYDLLDSEIIITDKQGLIDLIEVLA